MSKGHTLWAFDLCKVYPLPDNKVLVRNPRNGRHAVLMPDVYSALLECREFRTLEAHAHRLAESNPGLQGQEQAVRQALEAVRADGLLLSSDIYPHVFGPNPAPGYLTDKPVAAIITWERPEALARCLESVAHNCDLANIERLYVIDDSRSEDVRAGNQESTAAFAAEAPLPVFYVGLEEQRQFMERIIRRVPALEEAVRFLVDRDRWSEYWTSGLARTVALLLSVGKRLLVLDDDILCEVCEPHTGQGSVSFTDTGREAEFYRDNSDWQGYRASEDTDPFVRQMRVLGLGLADALGTLGARALDGDAFDSASIGFLETLRSDSPVLITECGSLGDPGTANNNWLTGLRGDSRERLLASDESVRHALHTRNCWSGRSRAHFGPRSNMSQLTGLDNRHLLPPYIPIMRSEDRLFGSMVEFLHPGAVVLDDAWSLPHLPIPERRWTAENRAYDSSEPFPAFIYSLLADHAGTCSSPDLMRRIDRLARLWEDLADLDDEQMRVHYIDKRLESQTRRFNHLKAARAACAGAPREWLEYLDEAIGRLNSEIIDNPVDTRLRGYPDGLENERLTGWWRDFFGRFAHAIRSWPDIRHAARQCLP